VRSSNTTATAFASTSTQAILERAGYRIRGRRADCPQCSGRSRLTVAFTTDGRFFCHRCGRGGSVRQLARAQGVVLSPPRIGKAAIQKEQFKKWLSDKMTQMSRDEYRLVWTWKQALDALEFYPHLLDEVSRERAWEAVARYYHRERYFQLFWESASDRIGRFWLYCHWRKHGSR